MLMADSVATVAGACFGTSTTTTYIESASGVAEGGRTGLTSFTVAILFALAPVLAGLEGSNTIFNIVFLVTILSLVIQGSSLSWVARKLNLSIDEDPVVETFGMEIPEEMGLLRDHIVSEDDLVMGRTLRDLHLPHGIRVIMVRRAEKYIVPHGSLELKSGDRLVIIMGDTEED
jgi:cell volume regulation protein A